MYDCTLEKIFSLRKDSFQEIFQLESSQADLLLKQIRESEGVLAHYLKKDVKVITIFDPIYPPLLKEIYDPPWVLYCKGDLSLFNSNKKLSVIGTRDPSENGLQSLEKILIPLIQQNWIIVSGLAVGIDGRAHLLTIKHGGKTIAVLGSGFDYIYPNCHRHLASMIADKHLLISEFPPSCKPQKWHFPFRNRIISGLTRGTIVAEARASSGSLITADLALQQGREVFCVPGSILDDRTEGTHFLIQQGAKLTKCSNDVLNEL